jgi:alkanesulfonate monooxygenase SsuD/methylene tetrahydromethanopterin reductase-like flavin-dependent oxidoreductase (luciferase family)
VKHIGFLSFGHWTPSPHSQTQSASDALLQSIDLAVAAEELGADGAYFRVHHFARQLASPFPLLAAVGARTSRIEIGTGVIDMRYENPFYMAEDAGAADLIAGGRLQLGISRGSPEQVVDGFRYFGHEPAGGDHATMAREHTATFLELITGKRFAEPNPRPMFPNPPGLLAIEPQSPGLRDRVWWGAGSRATAEWTAAQGLNLMSSTLLTEDTGLPRAPGRADPEVPRRLDRRGARARAEGLGQPQHLPDRQRPRPAALPPRDRQPRPGGPPRRRPRTLRQDVCR